MGQPRTERPLTKKLGALSGGLTVVGFTVIHDIWITDIWSNLGPMVASGALCGLVIVWSYNKAVPDHSARRWFAYNGLNVGVLAALGALSLVVLEPRFTTAETQLMDDAMGELMPPALPLMIAVILLGTWLLWALYGHRRSAVVPILLTQTLLVFLLGHQLAFLGLVQMSGDLVTVFAEFIGLAAFLGFAFTAIPILTTRARI